MPEGPEIRRAADSLADVLVDQTIVSIKFGLPGLRRETPRFKGHKVINIETRGKALLTHFEHGLSIYSHNQLYGIWKIIAGHKLPKSTRSMRLLLQTRSHSAILYSASDISVWPTADLENHPFLAKIGPDIMDSNLTWRDIAARLQQPGFAPKELAALYLDQSFLAGNGNYLRSEILHDAGLYHRRRPGELTRGQLGKLARSTLSISRRSYQTGGITLAPRLSGALQRQGLAREWRRFYVFGREDSPCYHCSQAIRRVEIGSRRLYFCPSCQGDS